MWWLDEMMIADNLEEEYDSLPEENRALWLSFLPDEYLTILGKHHPRLRIEAHQAQREQIDSGATVH